MIEGLYLSPVGLGTFTAMTLGTFRLSAWISQDLGQIKRANETMWRGILLGALFVPLASWFLFGWIWLAFLLGLLGWVGVLVGYNQYRLGKLGVPLWKGLFQPLAKMQAAAEVRKADRRAGQLQLSYLQASGKPLVLPPAENPEALGLEMIDLLLAMALRLDARRIEMTRENRGMAVRFWVDGVAHPQPMIPLTELEALEGCMKLLGPTFRLRDAFQHPHEVQTSRHQNTTALDIDESRQCSQTLEDLGLNTRQSKQLAKLLADPSGLVLVASPKGHGRTTTCYGFLRSHDAIVNQVVAMGFNPRLDVDGLICRQVDSSAGSYGQALHSTLLKEPDILYLDQVPDSNCVNKLVEFGNGGHRAYLEFATPDALTTLENWLRNSADRRQALDAVRAVVAQRLVRKLCGECREPEAPDPALARRYNFPAGTRTFKARTEPLKDSRGEVLVCPCCHGLGYRGRVALVEILLVQDTFHQAVLAGEKDLAGVAQKAGFQNLLFSGLEKYQAGLTSLSEIQRVLGSAKK